ncbi:MAG: nucleotidyl transferase AbiEii/AbiGii toxin family protein, partial [Burkholderiaceae bacterium]|nr:nucleotidyl transferase AbiEii/AbiGii toxin family protein [Burkholderiaceae bacterium]
DLPVLLDMPSPHLRAYPPETVIAEKFHAMVALGRANSRMKDYYDVWMLMSTFDFEPGRMRRAISATFARRNTVIPEVVPDGLSDAFAADPGKQRQWEAFVGNLAGPVPEFRRVVHKLRRELMGLFVPN